MNFSYNFSDLFSLYHMHDSLTWYIHQWYAITFRNSCKVGMMGACGMLNRQTLAVCYSDKKNMQYLGTSSENHSWLTLQPTFKKLLSFLWINKTGQKAQCICHNSKAGIRNRLLIFTILTWNIYIIYTWSLSLVKMHEVSFMLVYRLLMWPVMFCGTEGSDHSSSSTGRRKQKGQWASQGSRYASVLCMCTSTVPNRAFLNRLQ